MAEQTKVQQNFTPKKEAEFLQVLADTGNISESARTIGVTRNAAYLHKNASPSFAERWEESLEVATDLLEHEVRRRALKGVTEPVFYQGHECGAVQKYSDTLAIVLLKAHRPDKFRDNTVNTNLNLDTTNMDEETRKARIAELLAKREG